MYEDLELSLSNLLENTFIATRDDNLLNPMEADNAVSTNVCDYSLRYELFTRVLLVITHFTNANLAFLQDQQNFLQILSTLISNSFLFLPLKNYIQSIKLLSCCSKLFSSSSTKYPDSYKTVQSSLGFLLKRSNHILLPFSAVSDGSGMNETPSLLDYYKYFPSDLHFDMVFYQCNNSRVTDVSYVMNYSLIARIIMHCIQSNQISFILNVFSLCESLHDLSSSTSFLFDNTTFIFSVKFVTDDQMETTDEETLQQIVELPDLDSLRSFPLNLCQCFLGLKKDDPDNEINTKEFKDLSTEALIE
jgi:hypothetical protein